MRILKRTKLLFVFVAEGFAFILPTTISTSHRHLFWFELFFSFSVVTLVFAYTRSVSHYFVTKKMRKEKLALIKIELL